MQTAEQKTGRGRPKGTFSYAMIGTAELPKIAKIKGFLPVSKRFLTSIGVDISAFADFTGAAEPAKVESPKAEKAPKQEPKTETKAIKPSPKKEKPKTVKAKKIEKEEAPIQVTLEA